jgi:hypothetical protein
MSKDKATNDPLGVLNVSNEQFIHDCFDKIIIINKYEYNKTIKLILC